MRHLAILTLMALAGCGDAARDVAATDQQSVANNYAAKVAALPDKLRAGVMLRAIRDAGQNCQQVTGVQQAGGASSPTAWVATCDDQGIWVVSIAADGTAKVADARDVARRR